MSKPTVYTPREQEVIDSPDYYLIRVFEQQKGWNESRPLSAQETLNGFKQIRERHPNMRMSLYAARTIDKEVRLANVTPAHLSALVELNAGV